MQSIGLSDFKNWSFDALLYDYTRAVFCRHARYGRIATLYLTSLVVFAFAYAFPATLMNFYLQALGFDRAFIGVFHGASQFGGLVMALPALLLFDRIGRRIALVFGALFSNGIRVLTVLPVSPQIIIGAEFASGFGTVLFGLAGVSLLADVSSNDNRASLFAFSDFARIVAVLFGSVMAGTLPALLAATLQVDALSAEAYRAALLGSFLVRLLAIIPLVLIAWPSRHRPAMHATLPGAGAVDPAHPPDPTKVLPEVRVRPYLNLRVLLSQRPQVYAFAVPFTLILLAETLVFAFFNLLMRDLFGASDALIGALIGLNALIGSAIALLAPGIASRSGYRAAIVWGTLASAACIAAMALTSSLLVGVLVIFAQVAASQIARVLYRAYVINISPRVDYFIVSVVMAIAANIGPAIAPPVSGVIQQRFGYAPLFVASVALTAGAAALFWAISRLSESRSRVEVVPQATVTSTGSDSR